jgi:autotransporter-associated beta strand protein
MLDDVVTPSGITFNATGGGSYTIAGGGSIILTNAPAITANANATIGAMLSGNSGFVKLGPGIVTLTNNNTYDGLTAILAGTLKLGSVSALGAAADTIVTAGATLDVNGQNLGTNNEAFKISGQGVGSNGALINSRTNQGCLKSVTLADDTTISTTMTNGFAIGSTTGQDGTLILNGFTLTKTGTGQFAINGVSMTGAGNITVNQGTLRLTAAYGGLEQQKTSLTGSGTLTVNPGATLAMNPWNRTLTLTMPIVLNGGTILCNWPTEALSIGSPITLESNSVFELTDALNHHVTFAGVISGPFGLIKTGGNLMSLSACNTYTGTTKVSAGTLLVNGQIGTNVITLGSGATLGGTGTIGGPTIVQAGATLSPGAISIGTLTVNNTLNLAGKVLMEISKSGTNLTSDGVVGISTLNYGGSLVVTNLGTNALTAGDTTTLFAATNYLGAFESLTLPALAAGLAWDTAALGVNGSLTVVAVTPPQISNFSSVGGGVFRFTLASSNNLYPPYSLLVSTNLANWDVITSGLLFLDGVYYVTDPDANASPRRFYRLRYP